MTTPTLPMLSAGGDGIDAAVRTLLAQGATLAEPIKLGQHALGVVVPDGYQLKVTDIGALEERHAERPDRVTGVAYVSTLESLVAYARHHDELVVEGRQLAFADAPSRSITLILDAPSDGTPAWGEHRAILQLVETKAWAAWREIDRKMLHQGTFAEWIEDHAAEIRDPDAATMLEVAQTVQAATGVEFESGYRVSDGQRVLTYRETTEAKAGKRGDLAIPAVVRAEVRLWRGMDVAIPVTARLRTRISPSGLMLGLVLDRVEDLLDAAWDALLGTLRESMPALTVIDGTAPDYAATPARR